MVHVVASRFITAYAAQPNHHLRIQPARSQGPQDVVYCRCETSRALVHVMLATAVSDAQTGSTYATAKALFVAPRLRKVVSDVASAVKGSIAGVFGRKDED